HDDAAARHGVAAVQAAAVRPGGRLGPHHHSARGELRLMDGAAVLDIGFDGLVLAAKLCAPILLTALAVGFAVSLLQSVTQIQEITLSFVPKAAGVAIALFVSGQWMISELVTFTGELFERIPALLGGG